MGHSHSHFKGKKALTHVAEVQAENVVSSEEMHGSGGSDPLLAFADSARDTAAVFLLLFVGLGFLNRSFWFLFIFLFSFSIGYALWKATRNAHLGWSKLERLHRIVEQERFEIETNRPQEREELAALYAAKGFSGKLLEDVLDVLMSDSNRLLKVMIEEELGLKLESEEHPLKTGLFAFLGSLLSSALALAGFFIFETPGLLAMAFLSIGFSGLLHARLSGNKPIPALIWNVGFGGLAFAFVYFLSTFFYGFFQ